MTHNLPILLALAGALGLSYGCGKKEAQKTAPPPSASSASTSPRIPANVDGELLAALTEAAKGCNETPGQSRLDCSSAEKNALVASFNRGERSRVKALPTFTYVLSATDPRLRGLGAAVLYGAFRVNLGTDAKPGSVAAKDASALMKAALGLPDAIAMQAAPAVTHAMMLSGQAPALFAALKPETSLQVRSMAFRFLMVYGRLAAFDKVKQLAKDPEAAIALAALESPKNMQDWTAEEQQAICPWAESFLDDPRSPVVGNAIALLSNCGGAQLDLLLNRVDRSIGEKQYSFVHASALREMCRESRTRGGRGASEAQCTRARALEEKAVQNTQLPARVRALTLNGLGSRWPDAKTAKLVKKLKLDAAPEVKQAAEKLETRLEQRK